MKYIIEALKDFAAVVIFIVGCAIVLTTTAMVTYLPLVLLGVSSGLAKSISAFVLVIALMIATIAVSR